MQEFARQQLALNGVQQLLHFYGVCREEGDEDETIMLVYEYVMVRFPCRIGQIEDGITPCAMQCHAISMGCFLGSHVRENLRLVWDVVQGGNMRVSAKRSPQDLSWYRHGKIVARDVAQGLAQLHRRGLVSHIAFLIHLPVKGQGGQAAEHSTP